MTECIAFLSVTGRLRPPLPERSRTASRGRKAPMPRGTPLAPTAAAFDALSAALPVSKPKAKRKG